ncbi:hypothetical protein ACFX15_001015 [Malus domestica]
MAARMLQRRLGSLLRSQQPNAHLFKDQFVPSASSILRRYGFDKREIQTQTNPTNPANEGLVNLEYSRLKPKIDANAINSSDAKFADASTQKISPRHDLAMLFTCNVCETRSMKTCSRESYEQGVVVARCGGCNNLHLIADHLGYFGQPSSIEQFLAARGEEVKKGSADTLNLTLEDIAGKKPGEGAELKQLE